MGSGRAAGGGGRVTRGPCVRLLPHPGRSAARPGPPTRGNGAPMMITASGTAVMSVDYGTSSVHHRCGRYNPLVRRAGVDRILSRCGRGGRQGLVSFAGRVPNVRSRWFAVFGNRRRSTIGMPTHSQHPRRDRPRRHKGIDVSHPRCIMVSSRKTPPVRSAVPTGPGQGSCCRSRPLAGDGGTRSGTGEVVAGGGPVGGVRSGVFRVLGPPRTCPAGWSARPGYL